MGILISFSESSGRAWVTNGTDYYPNIAVPLAVFFPQFWAQCIILQQNASFSWCAQRWTQSQSLLSQAAGLGPTWEGVSERHRRTARQAKGAPPQSLLRVPLHGLPIGHHAYAPEVTTFCLSNTIESMRIVMLNLVYLCQIAWKQ